MISALGAGLEGLSRSREGLTQNAKTIASGGQSKDTSTLSDVNISPDEKILTAAVEMKLYDVQFKASAKVISTADQTIGKLIDETV